MNSKPNDWKAAHDAVRELLKTISEIEKQWAVKSDGNPIEEFLRGFGKQKKHEN